MACEKNISAQEIERFLKEVDAVHLYTVARNAVAVSMYKKLGFMEYDAQNELRPNDLHLIYYFKKEETN